jgi:hypothetical protein
MFRTFVRSTLAVFGIALAGSAGYAHTPAQARENYGIRLGELEPRGERGVLLMSLDDLMRLKCNPFFPYLEGRLREWVAH